jgi:hypothetical protein
MGQWAENLRVIIIGDWENSKRRDPQGLNHILQGYFNHSPVGKRGCVTVYLGQKPHDSGQAPPTSKPAVGAVSSPRSQYSPTRFASVRGLELFNNHAQFTVSPISRAKVKAELSAQVAAQEPQVSWQANLTLP